MKDDWKKGKGESAMIQYEKEQMQKYADEFRRRRAEKAKEKLDETIKDIKDGEFEGKMERYDDKPIEEINWTKYKIVVPTEADKKSLELAFEHLHYTDCDTNNVPVNQLIHEYLTEEVTGDSMVQNNIIVNEELYKKLNNNE